VRIASPANVDVTQRLLHLPEPSIQLQVLTQVLGRSSDADDAPRYTTRARTSLGVSTLLSERDKTACIPHHPSTAKWYGAHWVLVALAELRYPPLIGHCAIAHQIMG
jgi:hypothetical protein